MPFFAPEQLGPKQSVTPEGFLLCEAVPIARLGEQLYTATELPLEVARDLVIHVRRVAEDVFHPDTIASFEGKPVTMGHPDDFVDPSNWNELAVGHAQNVRRGEGAELDLLIADLLITNAEAIEAIRTGLREVSCGYETDYVPFDVGMYHQRNIIGNHIALVPHGRAGIRCSIKDEGNPNMKTKDNAAPKKPASLIARLLLALRTKDEAALMNTLESMDGEDEETEEEKKAREEKEKGERAKTGDAATQAQLATLQKTVDGLVTAVKKLTKDDLGLGDPVKTGDDEETEEEKKAREDAEKGERAKTGDALRDVVVKAEILAPGFSMPTKDSVTDLKAVVGLQRRVLAVAMKTEDGKKIIEPLLSGRTIDAMSDDAITTAFGAAATLMGQANNARGARTNVSTKDFGRAAPSIAELNQRNSDFWSGKTGGK